MTVLNNDNERFRSAADRLKPQAQDSSWNRLETMLENDILHQENKSYKNKMRWLSGIAACFLLVSMSSLFLLNNDVDSFDSNGQVAYSLEAVEMEASESSHIYDIDKLSILNDAKLWVNIIEGGPKIEAKKM